MGAPQQFSDEELKALLEERMSQAEAARRLGVTRSAVNNRIRHLEVNERKASSHPQRIDVFIQNGLVIVGSDAHIWPGKLSTAFRALILFAKEMNPDVLCLNGDVFDGAKISRWPSVGWEKKPEPFEELVACAAALEPLRGRRKIWTFGNHDWRLESYIAKNAEHLRNIKGTHLYDHFPDWEPCWRLRVNGQDGVNIKHRHPGSTPLLRGRKAGTSIVTGHLHSMNAVRFTDYRGDHFSVDSGTLARIPGEIEVPQFTPWTEDNAVDWAAGFPILTFRNSRLLWPEFVHVVDELTGIVSWRGELISV